ncbi:5-hydroxytryptamine receptor 3A-like [Centropristis striata]|uniref:5-hydroxytryptamine receptor 3A-like n=1 Tax=Centropristis striata TaxID=184440 RepID=UPI0027DFB8CF|nr:5-hydroxytryptamine receptor 3A-like [Centropristis striata]
MMLAALLFLLSLTGGSVSNHSAPPELLDDQQESNNSFEESNCTDRDVYRSLNINKSTMIRPGRYGSPTKVKLDVLYAAIIEVNEKDQKFVSSLWITMRWYDESLSWQGWKFCGIYGISLSNTLVWKPDLLIEEMIKMDHTLKSSYIWLDWDGEIYQSMSVVVTSACKMEVYKFPFDVQSCNLSFKSITHSARHLTFTLYNDPNRTKEWTKEMMETGSEWLFQDFKTDNKTRDKFGLYRSMVVYTIIMKRRSVLYVANFLLPVLFFFCLDLASFLISDSGGEKLSFKVTVLLAVTVMQLILNEILPSTSDSVPLIAIYCIGMFGLMMISLFETILVIYLIEKDNEADEDQIPKSEDCEDKRSKVSCCSKKLKKWTHCARVCDVSVDEPPSELLSATKEGSSRELTEESVALEKLSDEMKEVIQLLNSREEAGKIGYWTRVAKTINKVFVILYVTVAIVFLVVMFSLWNS